MIRRYILYFGTVFVTIGLCIVVFTKFVIPKELANYKEEILYQFEISHSQKNDVFVCISDIYCNTILDEENFDNYFIKKSIDVEITPDESVLNKKSVIDMFLNRDFKKGQILTMYDISNIDLDGLKEREMEFFIEDNMMGRLLKGSIVDLIVDYGNGEYDIVLAKKKVIDIIEDIELGGFYIFLAVNEKEFSDMQKAQKLGRIETRKYLHNNQKSCLTTFKGDFINDY